MFLGLAHGDHRQFAQNWASGGLNFVMVFSPEQMARAPHTYLTTVTMTPEREADLTRALARAFPNVTIIRVRKHWRRRAALSKISDWPCAP